MRLKNLAIGAAVLFSSAACCWSLPARSDTQPVDWTVHVSQYGVACKLYEKPGKLGPANYRVSDIGKPGVPALTPSQDALVERIQRYRGPDGERFTHLWFTFFGSQLVVFDTAQYPGWVEPCTDQALGYEVLSDPQPTYYESAESDSLTSYMCADAKPWLIPTPPPEYQQCP